VRLSRGEFPEMILDVGDRVPGSGPPGIVGRSVLQVFPRPEGHSESGHGLMDIRFVGQGCAFPGASFLFSLWKERKHKSRDALRQPRLAGRFPSKGPLTRSTPQTCSAVPVEISQMAFLSPSRSLTNTRERSNSMIPLERSRFSSEVTNWRDAPVILAMS
jgi:hypothetical protein